MPGLPFQHLVTTQIHQERPWKRGETVNQR